MSTAAASDIFEALKAREPIFHRPQFGADSAAFDAMMDANFWEVGASGRVYSRAQASELLESQPPVDAADWHLEDCACRPVGPDTYLFTYLLHQGQRISRRATIWRLQEDQWKILYHQGTLVST